MSVNEKVSSDDIDAENGIGVPVADGVEQVAVEAKVAVVSNHLKLKK